MMNFTKLFLSLAAFVPLSAFAAAPNGLSARDFAFKGDCHSLFNSPRVERVERLNSLMSGINMPTRGEVKPDAVIDPSHVIGDLDGPDGRLWYYAGDFEYDLVEVSEIFTDRIMKQYTFTIYDADMNKVGTITDKVNYREDETRVPRCELAPLITKNFFNNDDKYEVIVGLTVNTAAYKNRDYSIAYSIGGEKKDGNDVPVMAIDKLVGDVLNASTDGNERFYITFMQDDNAEVADKDYDNLDPDDPDVMGFWENLISYGMSFETYGPVGADGKLQKLFSDRIRLCDLPGDQQNAVFFMSLVHDGKPYFVYSRLRDSYFEPYYNPFDESYMREDNELILTLYTPEDEALKAVQETVIPTVFLHQEGDKVLCTYYSVGSMMYRDDVIFNADGTAHFVITVQNYRTDQDESYDQLYYVYDHNGAVKNQIFGDCAGFLPLSDIPGEDPEGIFITFNLVGDYLFNFVNMATGETLFTQNWQMEIDEYSDAERITSNMDRVKVGDKIMYGAEMRAPGQDADGNDIMRVIWFERGGKFSHIDEVNMGTGVHYAMCYISNRVLDPTFYHSDDKAEYMMLVKRGYEDAITEELIIGQAMDIDNPDGNTLLCVAPDERGVLGQINIVDDPKTPKLLVSFNDTNTDKIGMDFYDLPLDVNAGVDGILADSDNAMAFDGVTVEAAGKTVSVYDLNGICVARGQGQVSVSNLPVGVYVARTDNATLKINKK